MAIENENLYKIRKTLDLNQIDFAKKLDSSQNLISKYENANSEISFKIIQNLNKIFNIDINWLLTGKGEMFLNPEKNESKEKNSVEIDEEVLDIFKLVYKRAMKTNKINLLEECLLECRQKIK